MPETNSNFDEKSGIVFCRTGWGRWYQTVGEVVIEVDLEKGTRAKECRVTILPNQLTCVVRQKEIFNGKPYDTISEDDSVWTIEDQSLLRIQLVKAFRKTKDITWMSLLSSNSTESEAPSEQDSSKEDEGQKVEMSTNNLYQPTAFILNEMRKKLDLEQFQRENPGMDFSRAKLDKRYEQKYLNRFKREIDEK